jgi:tetratricopeptide (TPR) repeat protein
MKIADALMEKDQFQQAVKQFSKVLKRHPDHLPASLGYATAFERSSNQNQLEEVSIAYLDAARGALQRGAYDLADAVMRRAIDVSVPITKQKRLRVLKQLFNYSHTDTIAAEISYQIGRLSLSFNDTIKEARHSFHLANALVVREIGNSSACHAPSSLELGKIALDIDSDYKLAISFIENALSAGLKESEVEGFVVLGRSKAVSFIFLFLTIRDIFNTFILFTCHNY